jgi:CheY-like chemotaxis protein
MTARVLVVEDEAIAAMAIRVMLESLGCSVIGIVPDGREAVDLAERHRPDVILMDVRLKGGMSGIDCAKLITARIPIPIVFTTAYSAEEVRGTCETDGNFQFITKPIQEHELALAISTARDQDKTMERR